MNKKIILAVMALSFVLVIAGCSSSEKEKCENAGGIYKKGGKAQKYFCNNITKDAGKSCDSSDQCEGFCMSETKTCADYETQFGCTDIMEDGKEVTICVD